MIKQEINACARFRIKETSRWCTSCFQLGYNKFRSFAEVLPELSLWKMCQCWKPSNYLRFCVVLHRLKLTGRKSMPRSIWSFRKKLRDQVPNPIMAEKVYLLCSVNNTLLAFQWLKRLSWTCLYRFLSVCLEIGAIAHFFTRLCIVLCNTNNTWTWNPLF